MFAAVKISEGDLSYGRKLRDVLPVCEKEFKTRKSVQKHLNTKHPESNMPARIEFSLTNRKAPQVHPRLLKGRDQY